MVCFFMKGRYDMKKITIESLYQKIGLKPWADFATKRMYDNLTYQSKYEDLWENAQSEIGRTTYLIVRSLWFYMISDPKKAIVFKGADKIKALAMAKKAKNYAKILEIAPEIKVYDKSLWPKIKSSALLYKDHDVK
jgi:hypothetical protein